MNKFVTYGRSGAKNGEPKAQMRSNPGGKLDPADDVHRRCKKNSPYDLSCISKRTKEGCDSGSEIGIIHSWRDEIGILSWII